MINYNIIVAVDSENGIGKEGGLPWHLQGDMKHFKHITCAVSSPDKQNLVIMGRRTWESIPEKFRPLPNRLNMVLTSNRDLEFPHGVLSVESFDQAIEIASNNDVTPLYENIYIIGGGQIYSQALKNDLCQKIYMTHILKSFECDTFFPQINAQFSCTSKSENFEENLISYNFVEYQRNKV